MAWGEHRGWGGTRPAVAAGEEVFILTLCISGTVRFTPVSAVFKMGDGFPGFNEHSRWESSLGDSSNFFDIFWEEIPLFPYSPETYGSFLNKMSICCHHTENICYTQIRDGRFSCISCNFSLFSGYRRSGS
jgi:hypothetical protein